MTSCNVNATGSTPFSPITPPLAPLAPCPFGLLPRVWRRSSARGPAAGLRHVRPFPRKAPSCDLREAGCQSLEPESRRESRGRGLSYSNRKALAYDPFSLSLPRPRASTGAFALALFTLRRPCRIDGPRPESLCGARFGRVKAGEQKARAAGQRTSLSPLLARSLTDAKGNRPYGSRRAITTTVGRGPPPPPFFLSANAAR